MQKLENLDGFIAYDLADPPVSVGVTRLAPKILADGAQLLARSMTYQFATFERQVGGASAGINAKPDDRDSAIAAFVKEVTPLVAQGRFLTQAGRGLSDVDLAPLRDADQRDELFWTHGAELRGLSAAVAADAGTGGIDGKRVAVEGFDDSFPPLVRAVAERGARIVGISSSKGFIGSPDGLDPEAMAQAWEAKGPSMTDDLGEAREASELVGVETDVLFVGSKAGVIDHDVAARISARAVVPSGAVPVTAKALAVLRRAGVVVIPDFVSTAGPLFAMWPDEGASIEAVRAASTAAVIAAVADVVDHDDGPLLAACYRAEAFLRTWQDTLPFGRPLA